MRGSAEGRRLRHLRQAFLLAGTHVSAGVHHEVAQAQLLRPLQFDGEGVHGSPIQGRVGGREVDEVRIVRRGKLQLRRLQRVVKERQVVG